MTRALATAIATGLAGIAAFGQSPAGSQQPTFRSAADLVMVDASVRDGGSQVQGLTAADFVLLDNGVRQQIDSVEATAVPIDLTLIVDISGNPYPVWEDAVDPAECIAAINDDVRQVAAILRPDDRLRVLAIDTYVHEVIPFQPVAALPVIRGVGGGGMSAFYDTLVTALLHPVEPTRRHIIVARTKGLDTISAVDDRAIANIARQSDTLLHLVMMEEASDTEALTSGWRCDNLGLCSPTARFWIPFVRRTFSGGLGHPLTPSGQTLARAAELTGGALHKTEFVSVPSLFGTFKKAFDDFRSSYVLRYTPRGVMREGWHEIKVTVPARRGYTVHARRGYAIESAAGTGTGRAEASRPAPELVATAGPPPLPRTLNDIVAAFDRGDVNAVVAGARGVADTVKLLRDFRTAGNPWPAAPRREAVLALVLAEAATYSRREDARAEARQLLSSFHPLVRDPLEPDTFERLWLWGELAILEGTIRPALTETFVTHALARFPDEPRFVLARAVVADQRWPIGVVSPMTGALGATMPSGTFVSDVMARYEAAIAFDETGAEARIRLAWFLHRLGRDAEALERLDAVADNRSPDIPMRYLRQLMRGHVLVALARIGPAIESYQAALALVPGAQSARVALMNGLLLAGRRTEAEALAETIQTAGNNTFDPWWMYWQGDQRMFAGIIGRLREMAQ
jgi:VWFA-related protein